MKSELKIFLKMLRRVKITPAITIVIHLSIINLKPNSSIVL